MTSIITTKRKIFIASTIVLSLFFFRAAAVAIQPTPNGLVQVSGNVTSMHVHRSGGRSGSTVYAVHFNLDDSSHRFYYRGPYVKDLAMNMKRGNKVVLAHDKTKDQTI